MDHLKDSELLGEYVRLGSQAAFTTLVERHTHLVYSSALRQVRDPHLSSPFGRSVLLPDGSRLELERSDFGSTHLFSASDSWWRHRLDEWVPKRFRPAGGFVRNRYRLG